MRTWAVGLVVGMGLAWAPSALAQGTARSLDIQPGARQNAMGAAGIALLSDPADALWWNPAALGFAEWHSAEYTRVQLMPGLADDVSYQHVAAAMPVGGRFGVGASATLLDYEKADRWWSPAVPNERSLAVAMGYRLLPELALGLTFKQVSVEFIPGEDTGTTAFDLGALYLTSLDPIRLGVGACVQNVGPEMEFESPFGNSHSPLSRALRIGGAATLPVPMDGGLETGTTLQLEFMQSLVTNEFRTYHAGAESYVAYGRRVRVAVRGGYYDDPRGEIQDWTWGVGARIAGLSVDYAEIPQAKNSGLPYVQKWTFGLHTDLLLDLLARD